MNVDTEAMHEMKRMSWSRGSCENCGYRGSVTPYGRDEDGVPIGELCFVCMKKEVRSYIRTRIELGV